jgi:hypothetical protein
MGRQFHFHALPEDLAEFVDFACTHDPVVITLRDADRPDVEPVKNSGAETEVMTLWNRDVVPALQRELVRRPVGGDYYRVPYSQPVLELFPSRSVSWNGQAALLRGRVYGFSFEDAPEFYARWYDTLRNWMRSHFAKSPVAQLDGYIGPAALGWFRQGGILLPWPEPPVTPEWESFVKAQDAARTGTT